MSTPTHSPRHPGRPPVATIPTAAPTRAFGSPPSLQPGLHPARCSALIDLGTHADTPPRPRGATVPVYLRSSGNPSKPPSTRARRLILLTFTLYLPDGRTVRQSRQFTLSTSPRSGLFKFLTPWLGTTWHKNGQIRPAHITEQPCLLNLQPSEVDNPATGRPWLNILSASPLLAGMTVPDLPWPATLFTLRAPDRQTYLRLPTWIQTKIRHSQEWQTLTVKQRCQPVQDHTSHPSPNSHPTA